MTIQSCTKGLTDNAGHEIAGHEFATHDKFVRKYITLQYSVHFFNFWNFFMYGECVNVEKLTAPAHHKYSSIL